MTKKTKRLHTETNTTKAKKRRHVVKAYDERICRKRRGESSYARSGLTFTKEGSTYIMQTNKFLF